MDARLIKLLAQKLVFEIAQIETNPSDAVPMALEEAIPPDIRLGAVSVKNALNRTRIIRVDPKRELLRFRAKRRRIHPVELRQIVSESMIGLYFGIIHPAIVHRCPEHIGEELMRDFGRVDRVRGRKSFRHRRAAGEN